jgi:hypothetical protein
MFFFSIPSSATDGISVVNHWRTGNPQWSNQIGSIPHREEGLMEKCGGNSPYRNHDHHHLGPRSAANYCYAEMDKSFFRH